LGPKIQVYLGCTGSFITVAVNEALRTLAPCLYVAVIVTLPCEMGVNIPFASTATTPGFEDENWRFDDFKRFKEVPSEN
jgi:hypothetical protein